MLTKKFNLLIIIAFSIVLSACANSQFTHKYLMRGLVVKADPSELVVNVGTSDGAEVGQTLDVYRFGTDVNFVEGDYFKQAIGKVLIKEVINLHFARVELVEGEVKLSDMVQLNVVANKVRPRNEVLGRAFSR